MLLKRRFERDTNGPVKDAGGNLILKHIEVKRLPKDGKQRITRKMVDRGLEEGFISLIKGNIIFHTVPELIFKVIHSPGIFCCFDEKRMGDQKEARAYVKANFAGQESPDKNNPAGYRDSRSYACELVDVKEIK